MKLDSAQLALLKVIRGLNYQKSLYVYGGVGTGKTMLMKRFYEQCPLEKQYKHFHEYMNEFHVKMHQLRHSEYNKEGKLVEYITRQQPQVLCFDEFQVTDISDAMILYNILRNVYNQGKFVFFTSNRHPTELYANGIQRESFLPCIDLILEKSIVHRLDNQTDYRKVKELDRGYMVNSSENKLIFDKLVQMLTNNQLASKEIVHMKRAISVKCYGKVAVFEFKDLCDAYLGAADYLELTKHFDIFFIKNIPQFSFNTKDKARRFIILVDALYEKHKSCVFLAEKLPIALFDAQRKNINSQNTMLQEVEIEFDAYTSPLFTGEEELFAFQRAASRLIEMSHFDYLDDTLKDAILQANK